MSSLARRNLLALLAVVLFLVAWNRGIALLYGMFALLLATLITAWVTPHLVLRGVRVQRRHPSRLTEGDPLPITLAVHNPSRWRRYMLEVYDQVPCAPAAAQRPMLFVPCLQGTQQATMHMPCEQRGVYTLGPLVLQTGYPLGLSTARRVLPTPTQEVVVYPSTFPIQRFTVSQGESVLAAGSSATRHSGHGEAFMGVREYRHGDSRRHIHWPSSARRAALLVKEYEEVSATSLLVLLDLQRQAQYGQGKHSTLEYAVKITASLARHALDCGHRVGVLGCAQATLDLPLAAGPQHWQRILDGLARVQADGTLPYAEAIQRLPARAAQGTVLVLFHHPAPSASDAPVPPLLGASRHLKPVWIRFHTASFLDSTVLSPLPASRRYHDGYVIRRGDDLAEVFAR